jgi:hypothetical protein
MNNSEDEKKLEDKKSDKIECELCGGKYIKSNKSHHEKSMKHQLKMKEKEIKLYKEKNEEEIEKDVLKVIKKIIEKKAMEKKA